ncbi:MAG: sigma-70 family RNA polymerase sigma factor [Myxococcota bacterium]|nr:sigma-70 family RNA polymerase sigma factor [Myxococcota bacterium]
MDRSSDDKALLQACIDGDKRAWNELVQRYSRYIFFLINVTAKKHHADMSEDDRADLHNDFFLCLLEDDKRRLKSYTGQNGCSVRSWLRVIAIRRTIDNLRRRKKTISLDAPSDQGAPKEFLSDEPNPFEAMTMREDAQRRSRLSELTDALGPTDALLLKMIYVDKLAASDIARALRINKGAVYTRKTRLINRLKELAVSAGLADAE